MAGGHYRGFAPRVLRPSPSLRITRPLLAFASGVAFFIVGYGITVTFHSRYGPLLAFASSVAFIIAGYVITVALHMLYGPLLAFASGVAFLIAGFSTTVTLHPLYGPLLAFASGVAYHTTELFNMLFLAFAFLYFKDAGSQAAQAAAAGFQAAASSQGSSASRQPGSLPPSRPAS